MNTRLDRRLTARDLDDLPHERDTVYELIGGVLFMSTRPSFAHQAILANIVAILMPPFRRVGGFALPEPGLVWEDEGDDNVSPDVACLLGPVLPTGKKLRRSPDIAIEILSPGVYNVRRDLDAKRELYWRRGSKEYWVVDPAEKTVVRLTRGEHGWLEQRLTRDESITTPVLPEWKGTPVSAFIDGVPAE